MTIAIPQDQPTAQHDDTFFATLIANSRDGISLLDANGNMRYTSSAIRHLTGFTPEELYGKSFEPYIHADDVAPVRATLAGAMANPGQPVVFVTRVRHRDGSWRLFESTSTGLPDGGVVSNFRDITEETRIREELRALNAELEDRVARRTAELQAALAESRRLAAIIEATSDYVGIADLQGNSVYVNEAGRRMIGLDDEAYASFRNVADCYPARERGVLMEMLQHALAGGVWQGEVTVLRKDGTELPVSEATFPLRDADGRIEYLGTVIRDVSQQKRAEAELTAAKETAERALAESRRLASIIEATTDLVATADMQLGVTYMNRAGRHLMGLADDQPLAGFNMATAYPPEEFRRITESIIPAALQEGRDATLFESRIRPRSGPDVPVSIVGIFHRGPSGAPTHLSAVVRDMSDRVRIEQELQQAKEAAEAASKAKSTFLATMSHEIRTPMNAVIGMTGLLLNTSLTAKQRDFVETIRTAGDGLLAVINDILDFSKIEAGKLELDRAPLDLRSCIESSLDLLAPRAAEKRLDLGFVSAPDVPSGIVGDVTRLRQVLVNLVGNAIKFTPSGEVVVEVAREEADQGTDGRLHFMVRDTGVGIPRDRMDRLFKSFTQLDASTTRLYGGTGLGLAISRRLVEMMGGAIWAESAGPGQGTTFHFTITAPPADVPVRAHLSRPRPELHSKRLLVVDDHATNRRILRLQAESWGMSVREADAPGAALALLEGGEPFDLAILDMHMPEMSGRELADRICAVRPALPMVMLTSVGRDDAADGADSRCFAAFLSKPVKASQLYDVLVGVLAGDDRPAQVRIAQAPASTSGLASRLPLRILLVEDVAINQKFAIQALDDMGYMADVAANGLEALAAVQRVPYDVVFMDVQMPEMDGLEATRRIRAMWDDPAAALPTPRRPYIIAMTANALQGDREICLAAGMDDYVSKPVYLNELHATLARVGRRSGLLAADALDIGATGIALGAHQPDRELLTLYVAEAERMLGELDAAVRNGDARLTRTVAHQLAGSSRFARADAVASLCSELERMGASATTLPDAALDALAELHRAFAAARATVLAQSTA